MALVDSVEIPGDGTETTPTGYSHFLSVVFFVSKRCPHLSTASLALPPLQQARSRARSGGGAASVRCKPSSSTEKPGERANGSPFRERGEKARRTTCKSISQQRRKIENTVVRTSTKQKARELVTVGLLTSLHERMRSVGRLHAHYLSQIKNSLAPSATAKSNTTSCIALVKIASTLLPDQGT